MQLLLGADDVGAALEQLRRKTDRDVGGGRQGAGASAAHDGAGERPISTLSAFSVCTICRSVRGRAARVVASWFNAC